MICPWSSSAGDTRTQSWARRRRLPRPAMASWRLQEEAGGSRRLDHVAEAAAVTVIGTGEDMTEADIWNRSI